MLIFYRSKIICSLTEICEIPVAVRVILKFDLSLEELLLIIYWVVSGLVIISSLNDVYFVLDNISVLIIY